MRLQLSGSTHDSHELKLLHYCNNNNNNNNNYGIILYYTHVNWAHTIKTSMVDIYKIKKLLVLLSNNLLFN